MPKTFSAFPTFPTFSKYPALSAAGSPSPRSLRILTRTPGERREVNSGAYGQRFFGRIPPQPFSSRRHSTTLSGAKHPANRSGQTSPSDGSPVTGRSCAVERHPYGEAACAHWRRPPNARPRVAKTVEQRVPAPLRSRRPSVPPAPVLLRLLCDSTPGSTATSVDRRLQHPRKLP